ncbi:FUSC family protein [Streptomyces sp. HNM0574]|uniref:FUSC family protein n=1 Tax=Streptomyces sp. HNM0574 TaxID=2714954 RepID=UPI00146D1000|nr:FUSC family protein [Streptomyces sp. HNM0574]NLU66441.1 FUSC family protein [Streptomyces sp. HNM0574]
MPWLRALKETARSGLTVERTSLTPFIALRGACGVALVIGIALWIGPPQLAVSSAFGAFASGVATFQRSWRPRPVLALSAATGLAVSSFLGYLLAGHIVFFVLLLAVWAFAAGMAWGIGPTSGVVAALTIAVMMIVITLPTSVLGALTHAALIAVGGLIQAGLIILFPVRPWGERRDALADALAGVADYARRLRHDPTAPFDPEPLITARRAAAVTPRQARRRPRQLGGYRGLAESFRPVLASLADPVVGGAPLEGPERDRVQELLSAAATVLDAVARAIRRGERVRIPESALEVLQVPESGPKLNGPARKAAMRLIALTDGAVEAAEEPVEVTRSIPLLPMATWHSPVTAGEVRPGEAESGEHTGATETGSGQVVRRTRHLNRPSLARLVPVALRTFRREFTMKSAVFRHALRVAVVASAGYVLGQALPPVHGYWVPLTAVMVLRPDFSRTYERGVARFAGTLVGVGFAGAVMALFHPGAYVSAALAVVSVGFMYLLMHTGYAIASVCTGAYVVFLLGIAGSLWSQTALERIALTALGGVIAMLSYAVFPAWETPLLRDRLADWLSATGRYSIAVLGAFSRPAQRSSRQVREALLDTRASRQLWDQTVSRAGAEPVRHRGRLSRRSASDAQSAMVTMGRVTMLLEAHLPSRDAQPNEGAAEFVTALSTTMANAAPAIRENRPVDWGPVHEALSAWWERESSGPPSVALRSADLLTDALDDLAEATAPRAPSGKGTPGRRSPA